ncbi:Cdc6-related protein AAA superfamily ATPase- like protein [Haloterrigena turkmenica DSM 5511]|uniref:Cdc6-related protein AAA superfamily ATPase-like protein n=1 Tax=Haloterrigena turkmenica (strain ATCC 51198 / DSM 5511 / JCM 9101 / NCIMB 13204 / VKM B-1734 / 4k) TaxID=543526 RepID=D2RY81_HALTV|nr:AAA family ATPase [Haloterrigena turkmenica]ADB61827.1 Cdc6-related protein AAA superfamily ATPase- like protein [Haloterrigena turkmenica DSM 5511]
MELRERIARRRSARQDREILVDRDYLSPVVHPADPVGRGPVLEQLLDALEAVFDGELPPPIAVVGPAGAGTSAIVTAVFDALNQQLGESTRSIGTTTRAGQTGSSTWFVYVDGRRVESAFALYRTVLSVLSSDSVPESGVGTDDLRDRLQQQLARPDRHAVVAVDHHDEPETLAYERARELLEPVADSVSTVAVGREAPDELAAEHPTVTVPAYRDHELVEVVSDRASTGLAAGALDHESVRELAAWADGNAHDALAALFGAAVLASQDGSDRIASAHLERAKADVPDDCVHLDRVLSLSETRQRVLLDLVAIDADDRPIRDLATEIADRSSLTAGTVKRFLYELADRGVVDRVPLSATGSGRRPSALAVRFPTIAFRTLGPSLDETDGETDDEAADGDGTAPSS